MDKIPEDVIYHADDSKSIDGILARLSDVERRLEMKDVERKLEEGEYALLRKKVTNAEVFFQGISEDLLKHQESTVQQWTSFETRISQLTTDMEQGIVKIRKEVVQINEEIANSFASFIDRLMKDTANLTQRVDKLENLRPDTSLKSDGVSTDPAGALFKDRLDGKHVSDNASTASGSDGAASSNITHFAHMHSTKNADAIYESSMVFSHKILTSSSNATIHPEAKLEAKPPSPPASSQIDVKEKSMQSTSRQGTPMYAWSLPTFAHHGGSFQLPATGVDCAALCKPVTVNVDQRVQPMRKSLPGRRRRAPGSPSVDQRVPGALQSLALRFPAKGVDPSASPDASGHGLCRTGSPSVDPRVQGMPKSVLAVSGPSTRYPSPVHNLTAALKTLGQKHFSETQWLTTYDI